MDPLGLFMPEKSRTPPESLCRPESHFMMRGDLAPKSTLGSSRSLCDDARGP